MHGNSRHRSAAPSREALSRGAPSQGAPSRGASADAERVAGLLEPTVASMGMDLESVRITSAGRRRLLRIVVDADGGVSLDDIALASQRLSAALDEAAAMGEASYTLEVSSPGVDRPLTEPKHWRRAAGRLVTAPLQPGSHSGRSGAPGERRSVTGRVYGADAIGVRLDVDGELREFRYAELGPGRIEVEFAPLPAVDLSGENSADDGIDDSVYDGTGPRADEEGPDGH
jgi:ribosome maturation factor RimP